uniref:Uncharacterized protein n=1 Tax=Quercus lobata TaxID=97700 RepID=A0A7N2R4H5_QUELO
MRKRPLNSTTLAIATHKGVIRVFDMTGAQEILDDPIFRTRWKLPVIRLDLVKLENQLPLFGLQELYLLTSLGHEPPLIHVALMFLDPLVTRAQKTPIQDHFLEQAPDYL